MSRDLTALLVSGAWLLVVLAGAEYARRRGMARVDTRRLVHVAVATWIVPTFLLYESWQWAAAPALAFVFVNGASLRFRLIRSVEIDERSLGTVFFPLSVGILTVLGWQAPWRAVAAAGVLSMGWGDAAASFVGRRWGRHAYHVASHRRTLEGSFAMLLVSWLAIIVAGILLAPQVGGGWILAGLLAAFVATILEGVSLLGTDNLLVPFSTSAVLALLHGSWWG
jgi:phytol kinase